MLLINDILFVLLLLIVLIMLYRRITSGKKLLEPIKNRYSEYNKKYRIKNYVRQVSRQPYDVQKMIFRETLTVFVVVFMMYLLATRAIFFTAVISGSMYPTFDKDDLVLMQNIVHDYKVGDIIMFKRPDTARPVSHRIVQITPEGIRTKGDAIGVMDWWVIKKEDILGKAITIHGKPIVIKGYGKFFIIGDEKQEYGPFGQDYRKYMLFFKVLRVYGYVIAVFSIFFYIIVTAKKSL